MRLRVRHPQGALTLDDATETQTIQELKAQIANSISVPVHTVQVAGGFPPRPFADDLKTLADSGIRNGDALSVTLLSDNSATPTSTAPAAPVPVPPVPVPPVPAPPVSSSPPAATPTTSAPTSEAVDTDSGFLVLRTMEDDNSCLFRSIVVASAIQNDPIEYPDVTLGQKREKYVEWIKKDASWGGAIEIAILSKHFGVEIDSIDVQTGRVDRFGEGNYDERVLVIYSGIHYDAIALAPMLESPEDFDQTRFPVDDGSVLTAASQLAAKLREQHRYTDMANFTLKCNQCQKGLIGESDARNHAAATGHTHFVEYE
ncbi:hypothetical protein BCR43DRAFT_567260 [Syncephalastrum racemosum]|uniref:Ubiquitin thioesterase OTU n=1 Tax=Syncephalastrum racemosum TaxID=13706 RepID=A0A1X2GYZ8_SYNRA|nr:hypothetical protein BCR43DRAFT_567260 [Syncephalastrum racemosum]